MKGDSKKLLIAVVVIIIVILTGFFIKLYLDSSTEKFINQITELENSINSDDWERSNNIISKLNADWEKSENIWTIFTNHHEIDSISITIKNAMVYIKQREKRDSLASIASLRHYITHIPEMERVVIKNIF